jgi:hypothetical protein
MIGVWGASLAALSLALAPAIATAQQKQSKARQQQPRSLSIRAGSFTPAVTDPSLAAELARRGIAPGSFRFTPTALPSSGGKAVRVAVRARSVTPAAAAAQQTASASSVSPITPMAYNLGVSVGWKRFALSGDVARVQGGTLPGTREAAEASVAYVGKRFTGRVEVGADRNDGPATPIIAREDGYTVGVGGSFRLTRNLDVTGGVRYRIERDRLQPLADDRRDSQAVYVGTAFRF